MFSAQQIQQTYDQSMKDMSERKFDVALRGFMLILRVDPEHADAAYQAARIMVSGDRAARAIPLLKRAAEARKGSVPVHQLWAEAVAVGGAETDITDFLSALAKSRLGPRVKVPLQDRFGSLARESTPVTGGVPPKIIGGLLGLLGERKHAEAEARASEILKKSPSSAVVLNVLASAQAAQKNHTAALSNFRRATQIDPIYTEAYENWGRTLIDMERWFDAVTVLRRAVTCAPRRASALIALGQAMTRAKEAKSALVVLKRAVEEAPDMAAAHAALANAHARLNAHDDALVSFQRAVDIAGNEPPLDWLIALAQAQSRVGDDDNALENLSKALSIAPDNPTALNAKASVMQTLGHFDDAKSLFRRATQINPDDGASFRQYVTSEKVKAGDPIIEEMTDALNNPNLSPEARAELCFALGKALEDTKDYDRAFDYMIEANALVRKQNPYSITKRFREVKSLEEGMGAFDYLSATPAAGTSDFAPIFVTGMPRSGTTLVEQIISSHSTVTGAGELGEMSTLCLNALRSRPNGRPVGDLDDDTLASIGHDYEKYVRGRHPDCDKITDKAINSYMYMGLIRLALPNARFVVVRRDPRDNLLSMFKNRFPEGTHPYAYDQKDLAQYYGTFVEMIDFWRERIPGWFYEVQYEELVANPEEETRKLIAACGLEWEDACLSFHENKRKVQTLSVYQVRQPISKASVEAWRRHEAQLQPMLEVLREGGHVTD